MIFFKVTPKRLSNRLYETKYLRASNGLDVGVPLDIKEWDQKLADKIVKARQDRGLTVEDAALLLRMSKESLERIERSPLTFPTRLLYDVLRFYNLTDDLIII